ncbi:MAG TPA: response regulator [Armatimonadota bacterium]|jgi:CheY-like chemotaxis protein
MKRLLVVEDNAEVAKLLELILRRAGYDIAIAEDGVEALERFQQQQPDLVLLDIMLPRMDGYEVATHIRQDFHARVPIVMLSSLDSPLDMERSRAAGATDHIAKPFDKDQLLEIIAEYVAHADTP